MLDEQYFIDLGQPDPERLLTLPLWARDWINTLRFESVWQQGRAATFEAALIEHGINPERVLAAAKRKRDRRTTRAK